MGKRYKPLSTKIPPTPTSDHKIINNWIEKSTMPSIRPIVREIDQLIRKIIPSLEYAIKWGSAYYGSEKLGWIIEVAAYEVSVNIVFLNGASFENQPPLGDHDNSRYVKIRTLDDVNNPELQEWIKYAATIDGWKY